MPAKEAPATVCWYCAAKMGTQVPVIPTQPVVKTYITTCEDIWLSLRPDPSLKMLSLCTVCALMQHLKTYLSRDLHFRMTGLPELFLAQKEARDREFKRTMRGDN